MENTRIRASLFGLPIDIITMNDAKDLLFFAEKPMHVITINPEMLTKSYKDKDLSNLIKNADLVVPDGVGVVMGLKMIGINTKRVPGIELAYGILEAASITDLSVALIGADEDTIQKTRTELLQQLPGLNIVYTHNGYFNNDEEEVIIKELQNIQPDIILAGLGFPKQEKFLTNFKNFSKRTIMIGVGGSFDVWAKKVKRAPMIFQKLNLEWFYRLLCQPSRFSRIFPTIPLFLIRVPLNYKLNRKEY